MDPINWVNVELSLNIHGVALKLQLPIPTEAVPASVMLPVFQGLSNTFTELASRLLEKSEVRISCTKGCGACCSQAVPLGEIEVYHISRVVERLPEPRRSQVRERFAKSAQHFRDIGWLEQLQASKPEEIREQVIAYFFEAQPCPFLEDGSCSIYEDRPIACREYLVTSPFEWCSNPRNEAIRVLSLPAQAAGKIRNLVKSGHFAPYPILPMIFALDFSNEFPENEVIQTGEAWLSDFFQG